MRLAKGVHVDGFEPSDAPRVTSEGGCRWRRRRYPGEGGVGFGGVCGEGSVSIAALTLPRRRGSSEHHGGIRGHSPSSSPASTLLPVCGGCVKAEVSGFQRRLRRLVVTASVELAMPSEFAVVVKLVQRLGE